MFVNRGMDVDVDVADPFNIQPTLAKSYKSHNNNKYIDIDR